MTLSVLQHSRRLLGLLPLAALGTAWQSSGAIAGRRACSSTTDGTGDAAAASAAAASAAAAPHSAGVQQQQQQAGPPPVGAVFTTTKRYSPQEVAAFCALTGDANAIHVDGGAAAAAGLPGAILPGLLMAALFPAIIGSHLPGALYLSQSLKFKAHALVGEPVTATLTVQRSSGSRVSFRTLCCAGDGSSGDSGRVLVEGDALALIRGPGTQQGAAAAAAAAAAVGAAAAGKQPGGTST